jgi:stage IV sporulation protein FB
MKAWYLGIKPFGVPLFFNPTSLLLFLLMLPYGVSTAVSLFIVLMVSLIIHEYGHVLAGQTMGFRVSSVETQMFGAVAKIDSPMASYPHAELITAIAGPLTSLALALVTLPFMLLGKPWVLQWACMVNFVLAIFNILPIFPMDGGRVLRALVSMRKGPRKATEAAVVVTFIMAALTATAGLIFWHSFWIAIIMVIVIMMALAERRIVRDLYPREHRARSKKDDLRLN